MCIVYKKILYKLLLLVYMCIVIGKKCITFIIVIGLFNRFKFYNINKKIYRLYIVKRM